MNRILKSKYKILDKISESPSHITYTGELVDSKSPVIIKIFRREILNSVLIKKLKKDASSLSKISIQSVPRILDGDYGWQGFYFVREFVAGKPLSQTKKTFEISEAEDLAVQICKVMESAHSKGIIHGFLTPNNIFINENGSISISDFCLESGFYSPLEQRAIFLMNESRFLPPEIILGEDPSAASDIYQIGIILYHLLTKEFPSKEKSGLNCAANNLFVPPKPPSLINNKVPKYLDSIVLKCLENDPLNRFENVAQLAENITNKVFITPRYDTADVSSLDYLEEGKTEKPIVMKGSSFEESFEENEIDDRINLFKWVIIAVCSAVVAGVIYSLINIFILGE